MLPGLVLLVTDVLISLRMIWKMTLVGNQKLLETAEKASSPTLPPLDTAQDRRRPGRDKVNPQLIPLLRDPAALDLVVLLPDVAGEPPETEDLAMAYGIKAGLALSLPLWALIGGATWALLR